MNTTTLFQELLTQKFGAHSFSFDVRVCVFHSFLPSSVCFFVLFFLLLCDSLFLSPQCRRIMCPFCVRTFLFFEARMPMDNKTKQVYFIYCVTYMERNHVAQTRYACVCCLEMIYDRWMVQIRPFFQFLAYFNTEQKILVHFVTFNIEVYILIATVSFTITTNRIAL